MRVLYYTDKKAVIVDVIYTHIVSCVLISTMILHKCINRPLAMLFTDSVLLGTFTPQYCPYLILPVLPLLWGEKEEDFQRPDTR